VFPFESGAATFWAGTREFRLGSDRSLLAVVAIPEDDLLAAIVRQRQVILVVFAAALLLAGVTVLPLSRHFSEPLVELAENSKRIGELDLDPSEPIATNLLEVDQLAAEQERMRVALDAFSRYVPVEVVRGLLSRGDAARIGGVRRSITILFSDIVGFTSIAESMTPEALTAHLAEYFGDLMTAIREDGHGEVSQIVGDGVVAFWGAPALDSDHPVHAVEGLLRCLDRLEISNTRWEQRGLPALPTRFGLAAGPTVVGNVGAPTRLSYTAVGDSMNLASRVEGLNRFYGTLALATGELRDLTGERFAWRDVDRVRVKGKDVAVEIFEILGRSGEVADERLAFAARYEEALSAYRDRSFDSAIAILEGLVGEYPGDASVQRLLERCLLLRQRSPADDWDFTTRFTSK
jgi:adenylate cyclase